MNGQAATGNGVAGGAGNSARVFVYSTDILKGVFVSSVDLLSGTPSLLPGYPVGTRYTVAIALHPTQHFLYVANDNKYVDTYRISADDALSKTPSSSTPTPDNLNSITVEPEGRFAYASSPNGKAIYAFEIEPSTGALSLVGEPLVVGSAPDYNRPSYVAADPTGRFVYVSQMREQQPQTRQYGLRGYLIDRATGALSELTGSPFAATDLPEGDSVVGGPIVFNPSGDFLFNAGAALNAFSIDGASGNLSLVAGSPFSLDVGSDSYASNLAMDPQGEYLYVTNAFSTQHVSGFAINQTTGALEEVPGSPITTSFPFSAAVDPSGHFVYVGNDDVGQTSVYSLDRSSGQLSEISGSPFSFGGLAPEFVFAAPR